MVSGYLSRQTKKWGLNILNGVHNHAMEPALEGHILAGRLKEDDKKIVRDLTKSKMLPRNFLIDFKFLEFKEKIQEKLHDKYQASVQ